MPTTAPATRYVPTLHGSLDAETAEVPWLGAVFRVRPDGFEEFLACGAALIHPLWVATAAHGKARNSESLRVIFGRYDLRGAGGHVHRVSLIKRHDRFDDHTNLNDIALYKLATPCDVAPLAYEHIPPSLERPGTPLRAYGWGSTPIINGGGSKTLKGSKLTTLSTDECIVNKYYSPEESPYMFCTESPYSGTPLCNGDSGGPVFGESEDGTQYAVGIISFGTQRACSTENRVTAHARVSAYEDWISRTISEN